MGFYSLKRIDEENSWFLVLVEADSQLEAIRKVITHYRSLRFEVKLLEPVCGRLKIGNHICQVSALKIPVIR